MATWLFIKTRLLRRPLQPLSILVLAALFMLFPCLLTKQAEAKAAAAEKAMDSIPVSIALSDIGGTKTEGLRIPSREADLFFSDAYYYEGQIQPRSLASFLRDVKAKAGICYAEEAGALFSGERKLIGLNELRAEEAFTEAGGKSIRWLNGADSLLFSSGQAVCVVPEEMLDALKGEERGEERLLLYVRAYPAARHTERELSLEIAGTHNKDSVSIYCPLALVRRLCREMESPLWFDSLKAQLADNRELETLRSLLSRHFAPVSPFADPYAYARMGFDTAFLIHDELLVESLEALQRDIRSLRTIRPFMIGAECLALALAVYFLFYGRRKELAEARALGAGRAAFILAAVLEVLAMLLIAWGIKTALFGASAENGVSV